MPQKLTFVRSFVHVNRIQDNNSTYSHNQITFQGKPNMAQNKTNYTHIPKHNNMKIRKTMDNWFSTAIIGTEILPSFVQCFIVEVPHQLTHMHTYIHSCIKGFILCLIWFLLAQRKQRDAGSGTSQQHEWHTYSLLNIWTTCSAQLCITWWLMNGLISNVSARIWTLTSSLLTP